MYTAEGEQIAKKVWKNTMNELSFAGVEQIIDGLSSIWWNIRNKALTVTIHLRWYGQVRIQDNGKAFTIGWMPGC